LFIVGVGKIHKKGKERMLFLLMILAWIGLSVPPIFGALLELISVREGKSPSAAIKRLVRSVGWGVFVFGALWFITWLFDLQVNLLWFADAGYENRFWTEFRTEVVLFWVGFAIALSFWLANLGGAYRLVQKMYRDAQWVLIVGRCLSVFAAIIFGFFAENRWQRVLLFLNGQPFGKSDPVFGNDIGFYAFTMPLINEITALVYALIFVAMFAALITYAFILSDRKEEGDRDEVEAVWNFGASHFSALGVLFLANTVVSTFMERYKVLYSTHGNVYGAGWTDLFVQIPAYWAFMVVLMLCIGFLVVSIFSETHRNTIRNAAIGFGGAFVFWILGVVIAPDIAQAIHVSPNELQVEQPYIQREIDATRAAYGLDKVKEADFPVKDGLTPANLTQDSETLESARVWDGSVLLATNHQAQAFKSYYGFRDVDVVPYMIGGRKVQVMYSARELDVEKLPASAKTWQNTHLVYTHGFGATASPVNAFTSEGLPDYWVKDIPVVSRYPELAIRQPRIYFGEASANHVYVNTKMPEFDYPVGESNQTSHYDGKAGIPLGGFWRRLAIAWKFDGLWKTWSDELTPESRIIFDRDIATRTEKLVPFFWHETDIYGVIADGQLWYMRDFESVTEYYPYSFPHNGINYMRNAVKAVVNAYTGETNFYVFAPDDPVVRTYEKMFPGLLKPASAMPPSLRKFVRYPEGLLAVQADIYASYHMNSADKFYNREDMWDLAREFSPTIGKPRQMSPYFLVMALPGSHTTEYMTIMPFTPKSTDEEHRRDNLEAWLGARADGDHFGEIVLYRFPTGHQVQGPLQVGIKMNQDSELSRTFTLWNQHGSKVILGEMRVLPLSDNRLLNVQAVYLQSEGARMPQLKYVVAASGGEVAYKATLEESLRALVGIVPGIVPPPVAPGSPQDGVLNLNQELGNGVDRLLEFFQRGNFVDAGSELQKLRDVRTKMKNPK
jgi:uncharacterized membrane protein (UPF0182 family)